eukprot:2535068-Alexandrium_andersonii.AAC.1
MAAPPFRARHDDAIVIVGGGLFLRLLSSGTGAQARVWGAAHWPGVDPPMARQNVVHDEELRRGLVATGGRTV